MADKLEQTSKQPGSVMSGEKQHIYYVHRDVG